MSEKKFDPTVFLSVPREIQVTKAAARLMDRVAIEVRVDPRHVLQAAWLLHIKSVRSEIDKLGAQLLEMDGGSFSRVFLDGIATVDFMMPGQTRVSMVCTEQECERALMDIEDFMNRSGAQITRL